MFQRAWGALSSRLLPFCVRLSSDGAALRAAARVVAFVRLEMRRGGTSACAKACISLRSVVGYVMAKCGVVKEEYI